MAFYGYVFAPRPAFDFQDVLRRWEKPKLSSLECHIHIIIQSPNERMAGRWLSVGAENQWKPKTIKFSTFRYFLFRTWWTKKKKLSDKFYFVLGISWKNDNVIGKFVCDAREIAKTSFAALFCRWNDRKSSRENICVRVVVFWRWICKDADALCWWIINCN